MNNKSITGKLQNTFQSYPQIIAAYFYGSQITGRANKQSDLDLALVVDNPKSIKYDTLYQLLTQIIKGVEIDLRIVTSKSSPTYLFQVLKSGKRVYQRDNLERVRFESEVMRNFYDFQHIRNIYDSYLKQAFK